MVLAIGSYKISTLLLLMSVCYLQLRLLRYIYIYIYIWPLVPKFAGSNPAEAVGFLGRKNPQHAFLRRGSKAVGPMS